MMIPLFAAVAGLMMLIEKCWPGQALPSVRGWWLRIALVNLAQAGIVVLAGLTWDRWLSAVSLLKLSAWWGDVPAALAAYFVSTFVYYWWHRVRHESGFFWRLCHQFHHSPRRIEVLASFYKHPVEILLNSLISSLLVYTLMGCSVKAAAIYTGITAVAEYFYHWNIHTPRWIGALIQRPESHRVHHQYQHHSQNYADLPLWDWLFGTLNNPHTSPGRCGFDPDKEQAVLTMLTFRDVHRRSAVVAPLPAPVPTAASVSTSASTPALPPTCFGCRKRWACALGKTTAASGSGPSPAKVPAPCGVDCHAESETQHRTAA